MNENFVNFHVLISHSPSCLNRDDMNMQKSAIFGGKRRVRVSSQSLKRTMRNSNYYKQHFPERSIRTRELGLLIETLADELACGGYEVEKHWIEKAVQVFSSKTLAGEEDNEEENSDDVSQEDYSEAPTKKVAVAPWAVSEFKFLCDNVIRVYQQELTDKEKDALQKAIEKENSRKPTKKKPKKSSDEIKDEFLLKKLKKELEADSAGLLKACGNAIDMALSGRMATSGLMSNITGALAVAHAITTHAVDADIDWFTAVDDLQELGSGHLDTQEFSSGVFYRYASLNLKQLQVNLGLLSDIKAEETAEGRAKALEIAAHVLHMLATEVPSAKQQSFAAHNLADLALVSFSHQPISLANAFEKPVQSDYKTGGFREPSITVLNSHWDKIHRGYGLQERCSEFALDEVSLPNDIAAKPSLPALENWIRTNGQG
ncbi:type I-E CRISPR-associated protein Cas7/Cse4/CasC [Methylomonas lenta]|uniref:Type I-E CRISPR-associated protein Cas7/Cse4/CasC n=1 Tax=Methylomonas lenta TaxID=980561 RepID=A0A177NRF7_9GAMM|nr:type I-E CRISPR-associated protein Cas7/Cse4/CasC [Methylomonas lenta]OAI20657.1 type I-E CRISPR-associated protein Cas7/Cse4/CasC [Methylomonas lenta]